jgi:two-component system sensor histidine kinase/response regulator
VTPAARSILIVMPAARPESSSPASKKSAAKAPAADSPTAISAEFAEMLLGAMHEGVLVYDKDGHPVYCNQQAVEITGLTLEQHGSTPFEEIVHNLIAEDGSPQEAAGLPSRVVLRTGKGHAMTCGRILADGTVGWLDVNAEPIFSAGADELFGCCVVMRDATGRKAAEGALKASEEMKSAVMAASVDAILTLDVDGTIVDLNRSAERLYRTTRAAIGEKLETFIPWRDREVWVEIIERLQADPKHFRGRRLAGVGQRSDGSEFPLEATIDSLDAGGHQLFVTFVRDVTESRAAERRLADARDAALRASVIKSEFLATMSHEIRTPMNGVIGSLDLILDSDLSDGSRELATIARTSAGHLLGIIDDILDLSKLEANKVESQASEFNLAAIVEGVTDLVALPAQQKGLSLSCFVDPRVPEALVGDSRLLRQVLVNLIGNAVKFTNSGEVVIRAELQPPTGEDHLAVQFAVSDTGVGIPAESVEKLFEPFTQLDGTFSRAHGGTGLGLAISFRLVQLMGGELVVDSGVGRGSTFSFSLPFALGDQPAPAAHVPNLEGRTLRVLVAESSASAAETIERYLRAWGMVSTRATTAAAAIECLDAAPEQERFDVAIVAIDAGEQAGPGLAHELRERAGEDGLFVIALIEAGEGTAEVAPPPSAAPEQLFDAHLAKPVKQAALYEALAGVGAATRPAPAAQAPDAPAGDLGGLRVLIAEDNPVNQQVLMRQASRLGLRATAVKNGKEAFDALAQGEYDAVLMDCQMPVMDGYEATRAIREREQGGGARIPIVAVTANALREDYERCQESGMDEFVAKPVTLAALANAIRRALVVTGAPSQERAPDGTGYEQESGPTFGTALDDSGIDRGALAALQEDVGGAAALGRIVRLFLEQLDPQAEEVNQAAAARDHEALARIAHRMKSSCATLGAGTLADVLTQLEAAARDADAEACDQLAMRFNTAVERVRAGFEGVIERLEEAAN